jgi:hypothetical protein
MDDVKITNANLFQVDWAAKDRQNFLNSISAGRRQKDKPIAPGITCKGVLLKDVSGGDCRSVKAQLHGNGDYRAGWWNISNACIAFLLPGQSLEGRMSIFHRAHHGATLGRLRVVLDFSLLIKLIREKGLLSGVKGFIS